MYGRTKIVDTCNRNIKGDEDYQKPQKDNKIIGEALRQVAMMPDPIKGKLTSKNKYKRNN